ncbi:YraN family protein [Streptomyces termitum]
MNTTAHTTARTPAPGPVPDAPVRAPASGRRRTGAARALGRYGEDLAARRLTATGLRVLARNWRHGRTGEIDIVARDGDTLVICEVKTRRDGRFEHPMAALTPEKAARLRHLAACWLDRSGTPPPPGGVRIDLVGIVLPRRGAPVLTHARGVA